MCNSFGFYCDGIWLVLMHYVIFGCTQQGGNKESERFGGRLAIRNVYYVNSWNTCNGMN